MKTELIVLDGGTMRCTDLSMLNKGSSPEASIDLANPVFLIRHEKGIVLWDTGLNDELAGLDGPKTNWIFELSLKKGLLDQLAEVGHRPEDITYLALSHTHIDHTGNAAAFRGSRLILQEEEYDYAFLSPEKPAHFGDYAPLADSEKLLLRGDHDLFGDGAIQFISTPGHTPGHQSLLVRLENEGTVLITGDICYYREQYDANGVPLFNSDGEKSVASIAKIKALAGETSAKLWIQHDAEGFRSLKTFPYIYT